MSCPLTLIFVGEGTLTHMAYVFFKLILKPTWLLNMLSRSVFSWMCCRVWDNRAKSSAKSRSSSIVKGVHLMPLRWSSIVRQRTQSIAILNSMDDMTHPCRTPVLTSKLRSPWPMLSGHMLSESAKDCPCECCQTLSHSRWNLYTTPCFTQYIAQVCFAVWKYYPYIHAPCEIQIARSAGGHQQLGWCAV